MDQKFECDVIIKTEPNNEDQNLLLSLPYKCHICEKSFKSQRVRSKHIKALHEDISCHSITDIMIKKEPKIEDLPLSNFELEGSTTKSIINLTASEIINLKIKPFKCEDCDYNSSRKGDLKKHIGSQHAKVTLITFKTKNTQYVQGHFEKSCLKIGPEAALCNHLKSPLSDPKF